MWHKQLDLDTEIQTLPFSYPFLIVEEIFSVLVWMGGLEAKNPRIKTLGELVAATEIPLTKIIDKLAEVYRLAQGVEMSAEDLSAELNAGASLQLLDLRKEFDFKKSCIPHSKLFDRVGFPSYLANLVQSSTKVVTICENGLMSYSGALFLRSKGVLGAYALRGGIKAWQNAQLGTTNSPEHT